MLVAIPKETFPNERRIAIVPSAIASLKKAGLDVAIESGAGDGSLHPDADYTAAGARIEPDRRKLLSEAEIVLMVRGPGADPDFPAADLEALRPGTALIAFLEPLADPAASNALAGRNLTAFSMELMPRITRAQSMDALSSMATTAGYKAVLMAATALAKMTPMMMTAAGTLKPSHIFILGAGVAGLQAIATARRLGAVVEAYDIRPAVKEQVESLGARFVELDLETESAEGAGGYAKAQSEEFYRRQREQLAERMSGSDIVITTALVPGKRAPILLTREMVERLSPGAIVVDLAAEKGGNCDLTRPGETIVHNGVTIMGPVNLSSETPYHSSQMYSKNISTFLLHLVKDGQLNLNIEDDIVKGTLVAQNGKLVHPAVIAALEKDQQ